MTVIIKTSWSGIYSFGIFASALAAFVLTEYERPSKRIWALLGLGFLASYVANVLRMVVIVLVGYYTDTRADGNLQNNIDCALVRGLDYLPRLGRTVLGHSS